MLTLTENPFISSFLLQNLKIVPPGSQRPKLAHSQNAVLFTLYGDCLNPCFFFFTSYIFKYKCVSDRNIFMFHCLGSCCLLIAPLALSEPVVCSVCFHMPVVPLMLPLIVSCLILTRSLLGVSMLLVWTDHSVHAHCFGAQFVQGHRGVFFFCLPSLESASLVFVFFKFYILIIFFRLLVNPLQN